MQQDGEEEEERGHDRHRDVRPLREVGVGRGKDPGRERPHDQDEDNEPAPVDAELDPCDPAETEAASHPLSLS
jgi:hypothetical protein